MKLAVIGTLYYSFHSGKDTRVEKKVIKTKLKLNNSLSTPNAFTRWQKDNTRNIPNVRLQLKELSCTWLGLIMSTPNLTIPNMTTVIQSVVITHMVNLPFYLKWNLPVH